MRIGIAISITNSGDDGAATGATPTDDLILTEGGDTIITEADEPIAT